jgi:hypothetical protein
MKNQFLSFWSKGLIVLCIIALAAAGLTLAGCDNGTTSSNSTGNNPTGGGGGGVTISLAAAGENALTLTLSEGEWKAPELLMGMGAFALLDFTNVSGNINDIIPHPVTGDVAIAYERQSDNKVLKITFSKHAVTEKTGEFKLQIDTNIPTLTAALYNSTNLSMDALYDDGGNPNVTIGTNDPVTITIS